MLLPGVIRLDSNFHTMTTAVERVGVNINIFQKHVIEAIVGPEVNNPQIPNILRRNLADLPRSVKVRTRRTVRPKGSNGALTIRCIALLLSIAHSR